MMNTSRIIIELVRLVSMNFISRIQLFDTFTSNYYLYKYIKVCLLTFCATCNPPSCSRILSHVQLTNNKEVIMIYGKKK